MRQASRPKWSILVVLFFVLTSNGAESVQRAPLFKALASDDEQVRRNALSQLRRQRVELTVPEIGLVITHWEKESNLTSRNIIARWFASRAQARQEQLPDQVVAMFRQELNTFSKGEFYQPFLRGLVRITVEHWPATQALEHQLIELLSSANVSTDVKVLILGIFEKQPKLVNLHADLLLKQKAISTLSTTDTEDNKRLQDLLQMVLSEITIAPPPTQEADLIRSYADQLLSEDWMQRNRAVAAMARLMPKTRSYIESTLTDAHSRVRITALQSLIEHPHEDTRDQARAAPHLLPKFIDNLNPYGTKALARQIILSYGKLATPFLQQSTKSDDDWIAQESTLLLHQLER